MSERAVLIGGQADGIEIVVREPLPPLIHFAESMSLDEACYRSPGEPLPMSDYELVLDIGWPSRGDDGRIRYRYARSWGA